MDQVLGDQDEWLGCLLHSASCVIQVAYPHVCVPITSRGCRFLKYLAACAGGSDTKSGPAYHVKPHLEIALIHSMSSHNSIVCLEA